MVAARARAIAAPSSVVRVARMAGADPRRSATCIRVVLDTPIARSGDKCQELDAIALFVRSVPIDTGG